jgi:multiple sugar transport system substrate-binding protein
MSMPSATGAVSVGHRSRSAGRRHGHLGALALAVTLAGASLSACSSGGSGSKATVNWYLNPDNGSGLKIAQACSTSTYTVKVSLLPNSADDQRTELIRRLAAKDSSIDIMSLDPPFVPEAANAGYLTTFSGAEASQLTQGDLAAPIKSATFDGKLVAIPHWSNTQLLWFKKSAAQAGGVDPTSANFTWSDMIKAAVKAHKVISEQGFKYEGYSVWINALVLSAGGTIITNGAAGRDATVTIDSAAGKAAAGVIQELTHSSAASPSLSSDMEGQALAEFEDSGGGFLLNWAYVWAAIQGDVKAGSKPASLLSDIGWARYPEVTAGQASSPPYGGIDLGISKFSKHQSEDLAAVKCITSEKNQAAYMIDSGNPAAMGTVYDDPAVQKVFPMASVIRDSINAAGPRGPSPFYTDISGSIQQTWSPPSSVNPNSSPAAASALIKKVLKGKALL